MRRGFWIALLALGTVIGFGWGFARVCGYGPFGYGHYGHGMHGYGPGSRFEDRAADACVRAAERVLAERRAAPPPASAAPSTPPL